MLQVAKQSEQKDCQFFNQRHKTECFPTQKKREHQADDLWICRNLNVLKSSLVVIGVGSPNTSWEVIKNIAEEQLKEK